MTTCPTCRGTGTVEDQAAIGAKMRALRTKNGITLREMAGRLGFSPAYISDLERGRRQWREELMRDFNKSAQQ